MPDKREQYFFSACLGSADMVYPLSNDNEDKTDEDVDVDI